MAHKHNDISARTRLLICLLVGVASGIFASKSGHPGVAFLVGWDVAAVLFIASVLFTVLKYDAAETKAHALRDNPGRAIGDGLLLLASLASLVAVGVLLAQAGKASGSDRIVDIALGLISVIVSWTAVHTTYLLTYTRLYYGDPEGGVEFNQPEKPTYVDFAYIAFTLGMTFQVSDTALKTKTFRATVLRHTLLSYVFGTVIVASAINLVVSLGQ